MIDDEKRTDWVMLIGATLALVVLVGVMLLNQDLVQPRMAGATSAQTATAAAAATRTAIALTPHASRRADDVRALNSMSKPGGPKLGDLLLALWDGRQTGGTPSATATPGKFSMSAGTFMVNGVYVSKAIMTDASAIALTDCTGTTDVQYRKCSLCIDAAGTYRVEPGTAAATLAAALVPDCKDTETLAAWLDIAPSFTPGTTAPTPASFHVPTPRSAGVQF